MTPNALFLAALSSVLKTMADRLIKIVPVITSISPTPYGKSKRLRYSLKKIALHVATKSTVQNPNIPTIDGTVK